MQKLLLFLFLFGASLDAAPANTPAAATHSCECRWKPEKISCNQECLNHGGWSGKAYLANTSDLQGVACICNNTESERISANEAIERPVEIHVQCAALKFGKCSTGWKDKITNLKKDKAMEIKEGQKILDN